MQLDLSVFDRFPVLKTPRLLLKEIELSDSKRIFDMRSNSRVNAFIARENMKEASSSEMLVARTREAYQNKQGIGWAGILRDNRDIIGTCGFNRIEHENLRAEIGGELSTEYWGKNIALEAVQAIVEFGLSTLGLHAIEAKVNPQNRGAVHLLEFLGFEKEAHHKDRIYFRGQFLDMAVYTLIR